MSADEFHLDCQELQRLLEFTNRTNVQDLLRRGIEEIEEKLNSLKTKETAPTETKENKPKPSNVSLPLSKITTYGWDQSEKFVKLYITLKGVHTLPTENITVEYTPISFKLFVRNLNNKNMELVIKNLAKSIIVGNSSHKVKTDELVLLLRKGGIGMWPALTKKELKTTETPSPKFDGNQDPSAGIMNMMKKMYDEGDDDMKRTIAKAWTEGRDKGGAGGMDF